MKTQLKIDMKNLEKQDNIKFFRLLDDILWSKLLSTLKDPANNKSLEELMTELIEDRV